MWTPKPSLQNRMAEKICDIGKVGLKSKERIRKRLSPQLSLRECELADEMPLLWLWDWIWNGESWRSWVEVQTHMDRDCNGDLMMTHMDSMTHSSKFATYWKVRETGKGKKTKRKNRQGHSHLSFHSESVNWQIKCSLLGMWDWISRLGGRWRN